ncbi:MAG: sigma-54-dependent Fis family transcriptional regulator [Magnetococcales bacterium]|nr:sigma-54-dependent Fis family transcriptional regulator [Magnetococcales bacterium]
MSHKKKSNGNGEGPSQATELPWDGAFLADWPGLVVHSEVMKRLVMRARHAANLDLPVLIQGESGTGKDVLARIIHQASPRRGGPFVCVNCGAIPENLVEAELFGHEKGAFTGAVTARQGYIAEAHQGTLFLDEVGELSPETQVKLLRVIQDGRVTAVGSVRSREVDFRVISATNRDLLHEVSAGRFRNDLFHRLAVAVFTLPPLRERQADLDRLITLFLEDINREMKQTPGFHKKRDISDNARKLLHQHSWPGNIRELRNTLLRAVLWSDGSVIKAKDVQDALFPVLEDASAGILGQNFGKDFRLTGVLSKVADHYFAKAMRESGGNKAQATRLLGLPNPTTFSNWIKKYPWKKEEKADEDD